MLNDPVFIAIADYKKEHKGDVIRHELAVHAEILRVKQYRKNIHTEQHLSVVDGVLRIMNQNLNTVRTLIPDYLELQFKNQLKKTRFWDRGSFKANCLNWKYTFYTKQRHTAAVELTDLLRDKVTVSVKQVKDSAI